MLVLFVQPLHPVVLHCTINQASSGQEMEREVSTPEPALGERWVEVESGGGGPVLRSVY